MESHFQRIQPPPNPELYNSQPQLRSGQTGPLNTEGELRVRKRSGFKLEGQAGVEQTVVKHLTVVTNNEPNHQSLDEAVDRQVLGEQQANFRLCGLGCALSHPAY